MHPYLFTIGNFEVRVYSLMLVLAVALALYFVGKRAQSLNLDRKIIENGIFVMFISGIIGARLYYVLFNWPYFREYPLEIPAVWHGGLAIHGGLVFGIIALIVYCRAKKLSIFGLGDLIAPFILLGQGLGRIGNFANGEAHGVPTITPPDIIFNIKPMFPQFWYNVISQEGVANTSEGITALYYKILITPVTVMFNNTQYLLKEHVPWGISFPAKYRSQAYAEFGSMPVHPTFFYEMILSFIGAFILIILWRKDKNIGTGKIMALYMAMYAVIRGFVTFFRADDLMLGVIRAPHAASIAMLILAAVWFYMGKRSQYHTK
jgi:phosphatidylglycerol:prolipoprotein diacylglycerol transferase